MESPIDEVYKQQLEMRIKEAENENQMLHKELAVKNIISEISQFQGKNDHIDEIYYKIFHLISDVVMIDNFYVALLEDGLVNIPFMVDQTGELDPDMLREDKNPQLARSLTSYALKKGRSLILTEPDILKLTKSGEVDPIGNIPKQWLFLPFHTSDIDGGIVVQSYQKSDSYSYQHMSILAYVTMHIGNFLSARLSKEKIQIQYEKLKTAQQQLVQSEKMASIGTLAAGVAHEINNPIGYINSNLNSLKGYIEDFGLFIAALDNQIKDKSIDETVKQTLIKIVEQLKDEHDIEFMLSDTQELVKESIFGMDKVKKIIQGLKNFSHVGQEEKELANINECLEETIRIIWNELKYHCELVKDFAELPDCYCYPGELNQVFMNLLVNAGHAIKEKGVITIKTYFSAPMLHIDIRDNGSGIAEENIAQLFNPFFTTKPIGQGTGLGLSISYGIIEKHGGKIELETKLGEGTCFKIYFPLVSKL